MGITERERIEELPSESEQLRRRIMELEAECARIKGIVQQSEIRYRTLFEDSRDAVYVTSREGEVIDMNRAGLELFGYSREELIGRDIRELYVDPKDREWFQQEIERTGSVKDYEMRFKRKDGTELYCLMTSSLRRTQDGAILGYQGIMRDVTERRREVEALRQSEEKFSTVFHSSPDWIAISTLEDGRLIDVNEAFLRITGYRREEVIGKTSAELKLWVNPAERAEVVRILREQGKLRDHEVKFRMKNGEVRTMLRSAELIERGGESFIINISRDITERKRTEEEIRKLNAELQQRVAELVDANRELDAFSYSVSHDLRVPLIVIGGYARRLLKRYAGALDEQGREVLQVIQANVGKMEALIDDLLAFSRSGRKQLTRSEIDMEAMVREVFDEVKALEPKRTVRLKTGALLPLFADPALMRQVVVNLISNAFKFTRTREVAEIEIGSLLEGNTVLYFIKDNGVGFDMRHAARLFDVFQRVHAEEGFEGTGIGLSIVKRIINRHGGQIWAEGEPGKGAVFSFTLPWKEIPV
ncbi:MAG: PAS domain S-box protein [Nitrospirota bacterium]